MSHVRINYQRGRSNWRVVYGDGWSWECFWVSSYQDKGMIWFICIFIFFLIVSIEMPCTKVMLAIGSFIWLYRFLWINIYFIGVYEWTCSLFQPLLCKLFNNIKPTRAGLVPFICLFKNWSFSSNAQMIYFFTDTLQSAQKKNHII